MQGVLYHGSAWAGSSKACSVIAEPEKRWLVGQVQGAIQYWQLVLVELALRSSGSWALAKESWLSHLLHIPPECPVVTMATVQGWRAQGSLSSESIKECSDSSPLELPCRVP